jgi:hypothetical protein
MDTGAEALARRAQRFGNAPTNDPANEPEHVDEEARLAEVSMTSVMIQCEDNITLLYPAYPASRR